MTNKSRADLSRSLPYYKWYSLDYRANRTVQRMDYITRGLYRELLDECWLEGFIPDDMDELADICGCPVEVMANAWQMLCKCFVKNSNGFISLKLEEQRSETDKTRIARRTAGRLGGLSKSLNNKDEHSNSLANATNSLASESNSHIEEHEHEHEKNTLVVSTTKPSSKIEDGMPVIPDCPQEEIKFLYKQILPSLTQPRVWDATRAKALKARWVWVMSAKKPNGERYAKNRDEGLDFFKRFFEYVSRSDFLMGNTGKWQADLVWLCKAEKFAKVIEGNYENKAAA